MTNAVDLLGLNRGLDVGNDSQTNRQPLDGERSLNVIAPTRPDASTLGLNGNRVSEIDFETVYGNSAGLFRRRATPAGPPSASNPINRRR